MPFLRVTLDQLKRKLSQGEISFTYKKLDGSVREARGTTSLNHIPVSYHPKQEEKHTGGTPYFDTVIQQWRSISVEEDIFLETESLSGIYGIPILDEEEIYVMLKHHGLLEDKWIDSLIELIRNASSERANGLATGFKKMVRAVKMYDDDPEYRESLNEKFNRFYFE